MASLVKQDDLFYADFYSSRRSPNRKRIALKTRRRHTAARILARLEDAWAEGDGDPWRDGRKHELFGWEEDEGPDLSRLGDAKGAYLGSCSHLKENTRRTYREIGGVFTDYWGESYLVRKLKARHVLEWLDSTDAKDVTRHKYNSHLGYLFRFLVKRGEMERDISKDVPLRKVPERAPKALTEEHVDQFIRTVQARQQRYAADGRYSSYRHIIQIMRANAYLGLRRGEVVNLRWKHVDLERRTLKVTNTHEFTSKTNRERTIPIAEPAARVLGQVSRRTGYVFTRDGTELHAHTLEEAIRKLRREAGLQKTSGRSASQTKQ